MCTFETWFLQYTFILVIEDILVDLEVEIKSGAERSSKLCEEEGGHP